MYGSKTYAEKTVKFATSRQGTHSCLLKVFIFLSYKQVVVVQPNMFAPYITRNDKICYYFSLASLEFCNSDLQQLQKIAFRLVTERTNSYIRTIMKRYLQYLTQVVLEAAAIKILILNIYQILSKNLRLLKCMSK